MSKWHLQIEPGTWVLWGYGPASKVVHVDRDKIELGYGIKVPFTLPEPSGRLVPQEYERRKGFGWRFNTANESAGHSWHFAETIEEAVQAATENVEAQQFDTQELFRPALKDVRIGPKRARK
jgi:hypothetical protein